MPDHDRPRRRGRLTRAELVGHSTEVAPRLLDLLLVRDDGTAGRIVEVEAYAGVEDPASHARMGETRRNATMFRGAGRGYVYFTYGMHWCVNVVTGAVGSGQAVLIRALEPVDGVELMQARRPAARRPADLTNGPAKLCSALGITGELDGVDLLDPASPLRLVSDGTPPPEQPGQSTRIGISVATERRWRWFVPGNPYVSRHPGSRRTGSDDLELWGADDPRLQPSTDPGLAIEQVQGVVSTGPDLDAARAQILEVVRAATSPTDRATRPGHLTGSAFVVRHDGRAAALLFHRKLQRWLQPGGHADGDTNLAAVALREATEEIGIGGLRVHPMPIDLDVHEVRPPGEDPHLHLDVRYLVVAPEGATLVGNHESESVRWVERAELDDFDPDPGLRRLAAVAWATYEG